MEEEEGGGGGGFGNMNLPKNPFVYRASPPLTAINRFLLGQNNFSHQNQLSPTILKNKDDYNLTGLCEFSSSFSSTGAIGGVSWPRFYSSSSGSSDHGIGFLDDVDDEEIERLTKDFNSDASAKEERESTVENLRERGKKLVKGGNSLIKGQWTEEEDRKLVRLVKQFGVRKWAQIAEKMVGRAGKQCRERWHNHLRPDIKKDTWSEEEERMLVEAHQIVGNKWAEIAKRIPGRTENSIKNHWNATKRRQNARHKSGKRIRKNDKYSQSSFLQDYIKSQTTNLNDTNINYPTTTTNAATSTATSAISDDPSVQLNQIFPELSQSTSDDSPSLMNHTFDHDDELNFMQNLFGNSYNSNSNSSSLLRDNNFSIGLSNNLPKEEAQKNYLYSDLYLSYLLDGSTITSTSTSAPFSSNDCNFNGDMKMGFKLNQEGSPSERKEMDLIEMASKFYFPYN